VIFFIFVADKSSDMKKVNLWFHPPPKRGKAPDFHKPKRFSNYF
jgi:hypothetical protein